MAKNAKPRSGAAPASEAPADHGNTARERKAPSETAVAPGNAPASEDGQAVQPPAVTTSHEPPAAENSESLFFENGRPMETKWPEWQHEQPEARPPNVAPMGELFRMPSLESEIKHVAEVRATNARQDKADRDGKQNQLYQLLADAFGIGQRYIGGGSQAQLELADALSDRQIAWPRKGADLWSAYTNAMFGRFDREKRVREGAYKGQRLFKVDNASKSYRYVFRWLEHNDITHGDAAEYIANFKGADHGVTKNKLAGIVEAEQLRTQKPGWDEDVAIQRAMETAYVEVEDPIPDADAEVKFVLVPGIRDANSNLMRLQHAVVLDSKGDQSKARSSLKQRGTNLLDEGERIRQDSGRSRCGRAAGSAGRAVCGAG